MKGFIALKNYEGQIIIHLTASTVTGKIVECRKKLDAWMATFGPPPKGREVCQVLRMVSFQPLKYELYLRTRVNDEPRTIL